MIVCVSLSCPDDLLIRSRILFEKNHPASVYELCWCGWLLQIAPPLRGLVERVMFSLRKQLLFVFRYCLRYIRLPVYRSALDHLRSVTSNDDNCNTGYRNIEFWLMLPTELWHDYPTGDYKRMKGDSSRSWAYYLSLKVIPLWYSARTNQLLHYRIILAQKRPKIFRRQRWWLVNNRRRDFFTARHLVRW